MQTIPSWLFCWQWIAAVLTLGASAASAMPVIIALTLATGRRGNARLSAIGAHTLARYAAGLAFLGPLLAVGGVLALLAGVRGSQHMLDGISPWMPAMLPYSTSVIAWLAGITCLLGYLVADKTTTSQPRAEKDYWQPGQIGVRVGLALLAALCFFMAQVLPNWPFSGLPQGLTMADVALTVLSSTLHEYFTALAPAGSVALLVLSLKTASGSASLAPDDEQRAARWCALWAMVGFIPRCIDRWGLVIGISLRSGPLPQGVAEQALGLVPTTLAIACWVALFALRAPRKLYWLNTLGLSLLVLGASYPFIVMLGR
ncbi:MAG: spidroin-2 [Desulfovibrio sp.]|uniref:spidroin-2 n=1 Tax=Desulfovibrio sp. TaxID=885 RepID=UPI00135D8FF1|nr:spidroin-2 [Desulfovibrio sp.]MTJ91442.1 spidroin-2 [Desulfovibrio sp.]